MSDMEQPTKTIDRCDGCGSDLLDNTTAEGACLTCGLVHPGHTLTTREIFEGGHFMASHVAVTAASLKPEERQVLKKVNGFVARCHQTQLVLTRGDRAALNLVSQHFELSSETHHRLFKRVQELRQRARKVKTPTSGYTIVSLATEEILSDRHPRPLAKQVAEKILGKKLSRPDFHRRRLGVPYHVKRFWREFIAGFAQSDPELAQRAIQIGEQICKHAQSRRSKVIAVTALFIASKDLNRRSILTSSQVSATRPFRQYLTEQGFDWPGLVGRRRK